MRHCLANRYPTTSRQPLATWVECRRSYVLWLCLALLLLLAGCSRAPDTQAVHQVVAERLEATFPEPLLEISTLKRLGSARLAAGDANGGQLIVYYNARLTLTRDYQFSDWDAVNPAALANLLGASEFGITGIDSRGNAAGDILLVRGSVIFQYEDGQWRPTQYVPPAASAAATGVNGAIASARALIESIMRRFAAVPPSQAPQSEAIIIEELTEAVRQIDLRLDDLQQMMVIAAGPAGGEYELVAKTIAAFNNSQAEKTGLTLTDGSVRNAQLVRDQVATVALVQNDVARMAYEGSGPFAGDAASSLRALGSLFPEQVHIVVRADGPESVEALRGLRVDLGAIGSGTRTTALQVLQAYGMDESDVQASALGPAQAGEALARGEIDAFFTVISAPARQLQRLAADHAIRMLPLAPDAIAKLIERNDALVPVTLPRGMYPNQRATVPTVAVAALLVADADLPNADVRRLLQRVYSEIDFVAAGSSGGALISPRRALTGVTIPLHPEAKEYFEE